MDKKPRTNVDFSKHELKIIKTDKVLIHHLKKPNTVIDSLTFINTEGIMAVTGDYGNWIFCREFHPSGKGSVSDTYWVEKLRNSSTQTSSEFSSEFTRKLIEENLNGALEDYGYEGEHLTKIKEYYNHLLDYVDLSEGEYVAEAYYNNTNKPDFIEAEDVPFEKETHYWLKVVFDAFEEICNRLNMSHQEILEKTNKRIKNKNLRK